MRPQRKRQMKKCKHILAKVYGKPVEGIVHGAAEEPIYVISPKGCALLAFADARIELRDEDQFNLFWDKFQEHMENAGYIKE